MKTVLMLCETYYPSNGSGAHRPAKMAEYLPEIGWTPIVVCKEYTPKDLLGTYDAQLAAIPDVCEVVRVNDPLESRLARKLERTVWGLCGGGLHDYRYPNLQYRHLQRAAERIIARGGIDVIWATSLPGYTHKAADYLSRKYGIPWVGDFRDLPDQSVDNRNSRYAVEQEIKTCQSASVLVATTEEMAEKLRNRHSAPVYTILNGFDPKEYNSALQPREYGDRFTINHFGILYTHRDPSCLFEAIDQLVAAKSIDVEDVEINFYGAKPWRVENYAADFGCADRVKTPGRLPYQEMIKRQKASQVLLLLASPAQGGAIPAKLYGYLASERPILCVPGDGAGSDRILQKTCAGVSLSDPAEIASWLEAVYTEWKQTGTASFAGIEAEIQKYSRREQAGELAGILEMAEMGTAMEDLG